MSNVKCQNIQRQMSNVKYPAYINQRNVFVHKSLSAVREGRTGKAWRSSHLQQRTRTRSRRLNVSLGVKTEQVQLVSRLGDQSLSDERYTINIPYCTDVE